MDMKTLSTEGLPNTREHKEVSLEELYDYQELVRLGKTHSIDITKTTIGGIINQDRIKKDLTEYITTTNNRLLGYEFTTGSTTSNQQESNRLVIITGCDDDERRLPIFDHPVVTEDLKRNLYVCVDARKYLRPLTGQPSDIMEHAKDTGSVKFIILRGLLMTEYLFGTQHSIGNNKTVTTAYSYFIASLVNTIIGLNPVETMNVQIVANYFANLMFYNDGELEDAYNNIVGRISTSDYPTRLNPKYVDEVLQKINPYGRTINDLVKNIRLVLNNGKEQLIDNASLLSRLTSLWYGPGENLATGMALEHGPTWVAMLHTSLTDKNLKKCRLALLLDKYSKYLKPNDFDKFINEYLKEHTHDTL